MANLSNLLTGQSNLVTDQDLAAVATTGSYSDLTNKPTIPTGSYTDLTNKPTLATVATSGSYADLTNKPALAAVATSGSYADLSNQPVVISLKVTSIGYPGDDLAADPAGGQTLSLTGTGFETTPTIYVGGTVAPSVSFISSGLLNFTAPAKTAGTYDIYVVNPGGATAISVLGISYSGVPAWSTAAGSIGSPNMETSFNTTVTATSNSAVTYSIVSGALPSGISLNTSTGVISGTTPTVTSTTSYNFTVRAIDGENQSTDRSFSMSVALVQTFGTYTTTDLFMHYDFSNTNSYSGSGTSITDLQGTRNGTVTGATFGGTGTAKYFDFEADNDNYIAFGSDIPSGQSTSALALEAWIYTESLAGTYMSEGIGAIWSSQQDSGQAGASINTDTRSAHGGGPNGWHPQIGGTGGFATNYVNPNTASGTASVSNRWDHIVMTWSSGNPLEVYKNGTNITTSANWTATINWSSTYWALGQHKSNTASPSKRAYDGKIAIARIYNRRLTSSEVLANYNGQKSRFGL